MFATSKKFDGKSMAIISVAISYILLSLIAFIRIGWLKFVPDTPIINSGLSTLLGVIITLSLSMIYRTEWLKNFCAKIFRKTPHKDIWNDVIDFKNGSSVKAYIKDKPYYVIGYVKHIEEKGSDSYIAIGGFAKYNKITNEPMMNEPNFTNYENVAYVVHLSNVEHMEVFNT